MTAARRGPGGNRGQGMNWIKQVKRLAIYLRDGLACVYCGRDVTGGIVLTLDHLTPRIRGGANRAENLVTACNACNAGRCNLALTLWAVKIRGEQARTFVGMWRKMARRPLPMDEARRLIEAQGSAARALAILSCADDNTSNTEALLVEQQVEDAAA